MAWKFNTFSGETGRSPAFGFPGKSQPTNDAIAITEIHVAAWLPARVTLLDGGRSSFNCRLQESDQPAAAPRGQFPRAALRSLPNERRRSTPQIQRQIARR